MKQRDQKKKGIHMRSVTTLLATLAFLAIGLGGSAAAVYAPPTPPMIQVRLTADTSVCGHVTTTAHGFGILPGQTYQLVAGTTKTATAASNTISATFAAEPGWGSVQIRTAYGGYLASQSELGARTTWFFVKAC